MNGMSTQARRVLLETKLFSTWLATDGVVVIPGFFANQEHRFFLLLRLGHSLLDLTVRPYREILEMY